jgi:hypothetical protein
MNSMHRAQEGGGRGGVERGGRASEEECGEAKEGRGKEEEVRAAVGQGRVDGEGRWEGGWCMGGGSGLSLGAKSREFPILSNHSTLHAHEEEKGGRSKVEAWSGV